MELENFTNLFTESASSRKLINFSITDFGEKVQWAKISFGQIPLGIYRKGSKKKRKPIFHDEDKEKEIYQLFNDLTHKSSFYVSLRNFRQKAFLNFTPEDFEKGLYFSTFTFNNYQKKLPFSFAPWRKKRKCPILSCDDKHFYRRVSPQTSSFLAEKKIAQKKLGRNLEGVNDLFNRAIINIQKNWKPNDFKYVAVPELHKCQTPCHWKGKKHRKSSWKNHNNAYCCCLIKHDCHRNWHIHLLSTNYLPTKYNHQSCGLNNYRSSSPTCWDHRTYIVHDIWPYGLVDIKRLHHLKIGNQPIKSTEGAVCYLTKYLSKSFQMRANKEIAEKSGLFPGMRIYKFFRVAYHCHKEKKCSRSKKIRQPERYSYLFINNSHDYLKKTKEEFAPYFTNELKWNETSIIKSTLFCQAKKSWQLSDILKMCLQFASHNSVKKSYYWKPCDTSEEPVWIKEKGWKIFCPITTEHHTELIIRWEFEFKGSTIYPVFKDFIFPALQLLNLPHFQKFSNYQVRKGDFEKFARQAELPWNQAINKYAPLEEIGESVDNPEWQKSIPLELIYNFVYLKEISSQI